jgi:ligand-binding sensor domain-containing protein
LEEGLIEVEGLGVVQYWNPSNSPLDWNVNWDSQRCSAPALDFDRQGNLWVLNEGTENPLKLLDAEGEWHVFDVEGLDVSTRFTHVLATQSDQVWILLGAGEGVAVVSTGGTPADPTDDDVRFLTQQEGAGGLPSSFVFAVEEDLDGEIWVGTLQGPAVFYQPQALFTAEGFDAQQILIEQDGNFQFLLETETVWDIALDGGNRKWLATVNNGAFLLSPDGRSEVAHFTVDNSPLLSNEVYDIAIDQESGLVYFATPRGLTSHRGEATNFNLELDDGGLRIFPNPWRPEYEPVVTIDGLAFDSEVHIVNAGGERVRRVQSAGGRAVWDTMNDLGQPVPEGVYFMLIGEAAGKTGASGKMVILR